MLKETSCARGSFEPHYILHKVYASWGIEDVKEEEEEEEGWRRGDAV